MASSASESGWEEASIRRQIIFLGGRNLPWWAVLLSIVATETSTVTFLSIPGFTFAATTGDMTFLQITFGYIAGRLLVVAILLPLFFQGQPFTSYEVLEQRFGLLSRRATSVLFLATRNVSDALRLYLTALALQQAIGMSLTTCVFLLGAITICYTFLGGVKSVIWNDCLQFTIYMLGAIAALWVIVTSLPGGWEQLTDFGSQTGRFRVFDFQLGLFKPSMTFWSGLIGGGFLTCATHGTDQLMVQRYLSARGQRAASWALALSGFIVCLQFTLFLLIGVGLALFYQEFPPADVGADFKGDKVFSHFIVHNLGIGLVGLTLSAVFAAAMSTLSSSLNSSSSTLINDLLLPARPHMAGTAGLMRLSRWSTVGFGILQMLIALVSQRVGADSSTVGKVLAVTGYALGPLLGLYFLAVLAPRVGQSAALAGFLLGVAGLSTIIALSQANETPLYWPWFSVTGAAITFACGTALSRLLPPQQQISTS